MKLMSEAELAFGKVGYRKYENKDIIVYYKPYKIGDLRQDDITFCKDSRRIIMYQGSNYGPDAYRMSFDVAKAILRQCYELDKENEDNNENENK